MARIIEEGDKFYKTIVKPQFSDGAPDARTFNGMLNEFTVMENVTSSKPIINLRRVQNIAQRRDASCDIIYKNIFGADTRKINVDEWYSATKFCRNEFYQGDLKEFRGSDPYFIGQILPFFKQAVNADLTTNAYFGDVKRIAPVNATYSTTVFDGIFKWLKDYTAASIIPASQTITISDGTDFNTTPGSAYNLIKALYDKRPALMNTFLPDQQEIYCSAEIASGYEEYLIAAGVGNTRYTTDIQTGLPTLSYKGVPIRVERMWTPVISELKGSAGYAAVLTIRGNFVFGIDQNYGEGPTGNTAFEVWYDTKDMQWYWRYFMRTGTAIGLPEYTTYAISSFS